MQPLFPEKGNMTLRFGEDILGNLSSVTGVHDSNATMRPAKAHDINLV